MTKIYTPAIDIYPDVLKIAASLIERFHPELANEGVTIAYLFVEDRDEEGGVMPALKHQGYPAAAVVRVNSYRDRVEGKADATIIIDRYWWEGNGPAEHEAVIDHELHHAEIVRDGEAVVQRDDIGRPKLRLRKHDFFVGGFNVIAKRHGIHAPEVSSIVEVNKVFEQMELDFSNWG